MVPVINRLYSESNLNLPLTPMVWALAFGVCFGGNATIIGASANVVAVGIAEKEGYHVTFKQFFKFGMPVMIISCTVATVFLLIFNVAFAWHEPIDSSSNNN
jgi:Na+/H+ antiporter NhaD/arsenite permease-like protein